jgi:subtilisin family serine protease
VARNRPIGRAPQVTAGGDTVRQTLPAAAGTAATDAPGESLAGLQWNMAAIGATADGSHAVETGSPEVLVGIMDTGVDASHPDIAPNFNHELSRNFTTDIPMDADGNEIDGPCEFDGCVDPPDIDPNGHGTHVAGIVGAAANGFGVAGVAPEVSLVNLRVGQDSAYFFLPATVDALTYAGDVGIDVVNMSFFVDPWKYNCGDNPADSPEDQAEQRATVEAVQRALDYARARGVTLLSSAGNDLQDQTKPVVDEGSPNFADTPGEAPRPREIDPADCVTVPSGSGGVVTVSATGPSGRKAYYSSYGLGFVDVAAPGGDVFDDPAGALALEGAVLSPLSGIPAAEAGVIDEDGRPLTPEVVRDDSGAYYVYLEGTSMASPHAAGVAALIVSAFGHPDTERGGLTLDPDEVEKRLLGSAGAAPCPNPPEFTYTRNVVDPETGEAEVVTHTAVCEGGTGRNGFFGAGVISAVGAVTGH